MLLARRTGRTYGIESDPGAPGGGRRASAMHQPTSASSKDQRRRSRCGRGGRRRANQPDRSRRRIPAAVAEAQKRSGGRGGRLIVTVITGATTSPHSLSRRWSSTSPEAATHRSGLVAPTRIQDQGRPRPARFPPGPPPRCADRSRVLPRLYGDRGRAYLMGAHRPSLRLNLGLFHLAPNQRRNPRQAEASVRNIPCGHQGADISAGPKARLFSPRSLAFGLPVARPVR